MSELLDRINGLVAEHTRRQMLVWSGGATLPRLARTLPAARWWRRRCRE